MRFMEDRSKFEDFDDEDRNADKVLCGEIREGLIVIESYVRFRG